MYRQLENGELIPEGAQRKLANNPDASWVPANNHGQHVEPCAYIYRVPVQHEGTGNTDTVHRKLPGALILDLLADGVEREFREIHEHLKSALGEPGREEKATRVALQLLKVTGRVNATSVQYSLARRGTAT